MIGRARALLAAARRTRIGRALIRYGTARGALMAGGIAYTGMFSIFAVLVIGMNLLMAMLGNRPTFRAAVVDSINSLLPGVIDTGNGQGLVSVSQLSVSSAFNLGSVVAAGALIFGLVNPVMRPVVGQLANITGFLVMVAGVLVTAVASVVTTTLSGNVGRTLGLPESLTGTGAWLATLLISFLIDTGILALLITICGVRPPRRDLALGCMLGAFALGVLRQVGTGAVGSVSRNPLLASFAAIAVLVLWLHLTSRIVLLTAAWMANPPLPRDVGHPDEVHARERPNYVTLSVPETLAWPRQSITGSLEADPTAHPDYVPPVPVS